MTENTIEQESPEVQHLKAVLTEKNKYIKHLEDRNVENTKEKRQAIRAKIEWRDKFKVAVELMTEQQLDKLEDIIGNFNNLIKE